MNSMDGSCQEGVFCRLLGEMFLKGTWWQWSLCVGAGGGGEGEVAVGSCTALFNWLFLGDLVNFYSS